MVVLGKGPHSQGRKDTQETRYDTHAYLICLVSLYTCVLMKSSLSGLRKSQSDSYATWVLRKAEWEWKTLGVECSVERVTVSRKYGAEHRAVCCLQEQGNTRGKGRKYATQPSTGLDGQDHLRFCTLRNNRLPLSRTRTNAAALQAEPRLPEPSRGRDGQHPAESSGPESRRTAPVSHSLHGHVAGLPRRTV